MKSLENFLRDPVHGQTNKERNGSDYKHILNKIQATNRPSLMEV